MLIYVITFRDTPMQESTRHVKSAPPWRVIARVLRVNHSHLFKVVKGQRISARLLKRYEALKANNWKA